MQQDNTMKSELHNRATIMRHVATLLLLCRLFRDAVIFCALQKMQKLMTAEKRAGNNDQSARGRSLPASRWWWIVCVCVRGDIPVHFLQAKICKPTAQTAGIPQFVPLSRKMSNIKRLAVQKMVTAVYCSSHLYWLICDPSKAICVISGANMGIRGMLCYPWCTRVDLNTTKTTNDFRWEVIRMVNTLHKLSSSDHMSHNWKQIHS